MVTNLQARQQQVPVVCLWPELHSVPFVAQSLQFASFTLEVTISAANAPAVVSVKLSPCSSLCEPAGLGEGVSRWELGLLLISTWTSCGHERSFEAG